MGVLSVFLIGAGDDPIYPLVVPVAIQSNPLMLAK